MKLAVSNIAWKPEEEPEAYAFLRASGIDTLEIAPARWWPEPARASAEEIERAVEAARREGFAVVAFQAILFGRPELQLFETAAAREDLARFLDGIAALAASCGARPMVFGAPRNRRRPAGMSEAEAEEIAVQFFREVATGAAARGVFFCLEPNPEAYDCNFATHVESAARIVRRVDSPGLRLQIDGGELALNQENVPEVIFAHRDLIGHVHVSEAGLADFHAPWAGHANLAQALAAAGYQGTLSLEMKRGERGLDAVREAIGFVRACYGTD